MYILSSNKTCLINSILQSYGVVLKTYSCQDKSEDCVASVSCMHCPLSLRHFPPSLSVFQQNSTNKDYFTAVMLLVKQACSLNHDASLQFLSSQHRSPVPVFQKKRKWDHVISNIHLFTAAPFQCNITAGSRNCNSTLCHLVGKRSLTSPPQTSSTLSSKLE